MKTREELIRDIEDLLPFSPNVHVRTQILLLKVLKELKEQTIVHNS